MPKFVPAKYLSATLILIVTASPPYQPKWLFVMKLIICFLIGAASALLLLFAFHV